MLIERAKELTEGIQKLETRRRQVENADQYRTRAGQLSGPTQQLVVLAEIVKAFRQQGIAVAVDTDKALALKARVLETAQKYGADAESILAGDGQLRFTFWAPLEDLPKQIDAALRDAWTHLLQTSLPVGRQELLDVLGEIPAFVEHVRTIRQGLQQAHQLGKSVPRSIAEFDQIEALAQRLRLAWQRLQSDEISPEVLGFLRGASAHKSTLADVTPQVREWLERHGLLGSFKVTL